MKIDVLSLDFFDSSLKKLQFNSMELEYLNNLICGLEIHR